MKSRGPNERKSVNLLVKLAALGSNEYIEKFVTNLSSGGMFIWSRDAVREGTELQVRVEIAGGARVLQGQVVVRWSRHPKDPAGPPGWGVEFTNLDPASAALIDRLLGKEPEPAPPPAPEPAPPPATVEAAGVDAEFSEDFAAVEAVEEAQPALSIDDLDIVAEADPVEFSPLVQPLPLSAVAAAPTTSIGGMTIELTGEEAAQVQDAPTGRYVMPPESLLGSPTVQVAQELAAAAPAAQTAVGGMTIELTGEEAAQEEREPTRRFGQHDHPASPAPQPPAPAPPARAGVPAVATAPLARPMPPPPPAPVAPVAPVAPAAPARPAAAPSAPTTSVGGMTIELTGEEAAQEVREPTRKFGQGDAAEAARPAPPPPSRPVATVTRIGGMTVELSSEELEQVQDDPTGQYDPHQFESSVEVAPEITAPAPAPPASRPTHTTIGGMTIELSSEELEQVQDDPTGQYDPHPDMSSVEVSRELEAERPWQPSDGYSTTIELTGEEAAQRAEEPTGRWMIMPDSQEVIGVPRAPDPLELDPSQEQAFAQPAPPRRLSPPGLETPAAERPVVEPLSWKPTPARTQDSGTATVALTGAPSSQLGEAPDLPTPAYAQQALALGTPVALGGDPAAPKAEVPTGKYAASPTVEVSEELAEPVPSSATVALGGDPAAPKAEVPTGKFAASPSVEVDPELTAPRPEGAARPSRPSGRSGLSPAVKTVALQGEAAPTAAELQTGKFPVSSTVALGGEAAPTPAEVPTGKFPVSAPASTVALRGEAAPTPAEVPTGKFPVSPAAAPAGKPAPAPSAPKGRQESGRFAAVPADAAAPRPVAPAPPPPPSSATNVTDPDLRPVGAVLATAELRALRTPVAGPAVPPPPAAPAAGPGTAPLSGPAVPPPPPPAAVRAAPVAPPPGIAPIAGPGALAIAARGVGPRTAPPPRSPAVAPEPMDAVDIDLDELVDTTPEPEPTSVFVDPSIYAPTQTSIPAIQAPPTQGKGVPALKSTRPPTAPLPRGTLKPAPIRRSRLDEELVFLGKPPAFIEDSPVVGIDLGTTNSCCAVLSGGKPVVLKTKDGVNTIPSLVAINKQQKLAVGAFAHAEMLQNPEQCIYGSKRLLGREFESPAVAAVRERFHYEIVAGRDGKAAVKLGGKRVTLEEVQAIILNECRQLAETFLAKPVRRAVITCPAYFTEQQRQSIRAAGQMAGLRVERILNEPTAAALAYGLNQEMSRNVLVYDVGGGTFDATLLRIEKNVFEVLATGGDTFLGGLDFDNQLIEMLLKKFETQHKVPFSADPGALARVADQAEKAKIALSEKLSVDLRLPMLQLGKRGKPLGLQCTLTRKELEDSCAPLVERTVEVLGELFTDAKMTPAEVDEVVLVGGMSRMPMVRERLKTMFKKPPHASVNAEEAVAVGAALYSGVVDKVSNVVLIDVAPMTLGFGLPGGGYKRMISRNTPLPASASIGFATTDDQVEVIEVSVFQGEDADVSVNDYVGTVRVDGLPKGPKGLVKVAINLKLDADCVLHVEAREMHTRRLFASTLATRYTSAEARSRLGIQPQRARAALEKKAVELQKRGSRFWGFFRQMVSRKK